MRINNIDDTVTEDKDKISRITAKQARYIE